MSVLITGPALVVVGSVAGLAGIVAGEAGATRVADSGVETFIWALSSQAFSQVIAHKYFGAVKKLFILININ